MIFNGKAIKYGDHIDTDVIIPARYLNKSDMAHLAKHCMEDMDTTFPSRAGGSIVVAGKNFGCGSSREHAPLALKASGVQCVVAESFARIFYRNAINIALPIIECPDAASEIAEGNEICVNTDEGVLTNLTTGNRFSFNAMPPFIEQLMASGGLVEYTRRKLEQKNP